MEKSQNGQGQVDIYFRFRALSKTPDGILLKFLKKQKDTGFSKEMVLRAARAFWLAEAYQNCGVKQGAELKKLAQNMILVLEDQAAYLRAMFNLERPSCQQIPFPIYATPPINAVQAPLQEPTQELDKVHPVEEESLAWGSVPPLDTGGL
ncbi:MULTISPECIES: hypothetical protein [unclassified Coleofasciculus]|uniref:hypothetical protein n=1 Tax=unclassified Coleofasciculus TaxID=2692782 RepID=UPI001882FE98|nr:MULTISPECIES: hypothetical protein [unclassified Coleofasciculus]MBE9128701.1 hypothetical protein [Coleofasciculus sp. LEGE 07081]MBE9149884.1 hypothetical protein [Coleofasciculus sp. LEGE 07092]